MIKVEGGKRNIWCPFEYEYCPDFCFVCGRIGHVEKECSIKLKKGEEPQYGRWLRWVPPQKQYSAESRWSWGSGGGGHRQGSWGSGGGRTGSDAPSWKKPGALSGNSSKSMEGEKEVTSPLKITDGQGAGKGNAKKVLQFEATGKNQKQEELAERVEKEGGKELAVGGKGGKEGKGSEFEKGIEAIKKGEEEGDGGRVLSEGGKEVQNTTPKKGKFKRLARERKVEVQGRSPVKGGGKRRSDWMEIDAGAQQKKMKGGDVVMVEGGECTKPVEAGLSEQLRSTQ
jgi:hypothetical protein